jgi:hypothetical protein
MFLILGSSVGPSRRHVLESEAPRGVKTPDLKPSVTPAGGEHRRNAYTVNGFPAPDRKPNLSLLSKLYSTVTGYSGNQVTVVTELRVGQQRNLEFDSWQRHFLFTASRLELPEPVPYPLLLRKSGSAGNQTRISGSVARNCDTRPQRRSIYIYT